MGGSIVSNEMKFVDNMALWPTVEFGHIIIFCYFIERPGTYTKKAMEEPRCVQVFQEWLRSHYQGLGQRFLLLRRTGASEPQQKKLLKRPAELG